MPLRRDHTARTIHYPNDERVRFRADVFARDAARENPWLHGSALDERCPDSVRERAKKRGGEVWLMDGTAGLVEQPVLMSANELERLIAPQQDG